MSANGHPDKHFRKATPSENLRILRGRLYERLSEAERQELMEAADLLEAPVSSTRLMTDEAVMLDQQRELERLRDFQRKVEESEANCCPEDVGFEEWIGILTKRLADAEDRYQSAVHGRAEFRSALKTARQEGAGSQAGPAAGGEPAAPSASSVSPQREKP